MEFPCTKGLAKREFRGQDRCPREAVEFYQSLAFRGFQFAACRECIAENDVKGSYVHITREEYLVRQVMET